MRCRSFFSLLALSLIFALAFALILGASLSERASIVDGTAEVEIGQTKLPLCTFSVPLNTVKWGQVIGNLTALINQHQGVVIETVRIQGNTMLLSPTDSGGTANYIANILAQRVYVKIAKVLHTYASPPTKQS